MTYATAEQKLARIPEQYLDEVCHYLDALAGHISHNTPAPSTRMRSPGLMKGEFYMADDFDAPLEDFKEYM